MVDRYNQTIMKKKLKYFTHFKTKKYIDVLNLLVESYNNTYHSTIKMKPAEVNANNQNQV